ncbi:MAG: hypothetical protein V4812_18840 [Pseudomonadota bacterium]
MSFAIFRRKNRSMISGPITLVVGNRLALKLEGLGPDKRHIVIKSSITAPLSIEQKGSDGQREQLITLTAKQAWPLLSLEAYEKTSGARIDQCKTPETLRCVTSVQITIVEPLQLPAENTDAGALARLLLAESISPGKNYPGGADSLLAMQWMRVVIENRMRFKDAQYLGDPAARTITAVIKASKGGEQFKSFSGYPVIGSVQSKIISDSLNFANDGTYGEFAAYRLHVQNAIAVATGVSVSADPTSSGLYAWRTADSGSPGNNFVFYKNFGGQGFYTLTSEFMANPKDPGRKR